MLESEQYLRHNLVAYAYFYNADGTPKAIGTELRNPDLAATLRVIANNGADAFYKGAIASDIVHTVRANPNGGRLVESDFTSYQVKERTALCTDYKRWRVCGMPPPSSGGIAVAQMLGILGVLGSIGTENWVKAQQHTAQ